MTTFSAASTVRLLSWKLLLLLLFLVLGLFSGAPRRRTSTANGVFAAEQEQQGYATSASAIIDDKGKIQPDRIRSDDSNKLRHPTSRNISNHTPLTLRWKTGTLRPSDLPKRSIFRDFHTNGTMQLSSGVTVNYADGQVVQINKVEQNSHSTVNANVSIIQSALTRAAVDEMLTMLRAYQTLDEDPDTVDGMPSYEIFIDSIDLEAKHTTKVLDTDPKALAERRVLRQKLKAITQPYIDTVITPFVRDKYPEQCNNHTAEGRACTPCYSLIRRYRHGERQSHATHHDGHARVSVVISLSDYGVDYVGGLYVSTGHGYRHFLALNKGDAAVHQSTLLHGVQVDDLDGPGQDPMQTERWSWILWYRDSETCQDHSIEWFEQCSNDGDAICQMLHSTKVANMEGNQEELAARIIALNLQAAHGGAAQAAIKVARAYLKQLPSSLPFSVEKAKEYFSMACESHNPEGHYGLAQLLIAEASRTDDKILQMAKLTKAIRHLESASLLGHAYSMFNLGLAHVFGYGMPKNKIDMALGAQWFVQSGLPEGFITAANYAASIGDETNRLRWEERGKILGYHQPWRKFARQRTGSGGAAGVDLNLPWPMSVRGIRPPEY